MSLRSSSLGWFLSVAIGVLSLLSYLPLRFAEYVQDDHLAVETNPVVERGDLVEIFTTSYWFGAKGDDVSLYRPATIWSYAIERRIVGRASPYLSHAVNVALHALTSIAAFVLARRIGAGLAASIVAGFLFASHPGHSEAVANVVGRSELLAALFVLAALLCASAAGRWEPPDSFPSTGSPGAHRLAAWCAGACVFLALGSKEVGIVAPALIVVQDLLFRPPPRGRLVAWIVDRSGALAPSVLAVLLYLALRTFALESWVAVQKVHPADNPLVGLSGSASVATALAIAVSYGRLMLFPAGLSSDYSGNALPREASLLSPMPLLGLALLAGTLSLVAAPWLVPVLPRWLRAGRFSEGGPRRASFAACIVLFPYLVTGNLLVRVGAGFAERFLYLPSVGICLGMGCLAAALARAGPRTPGGWIRTLRARIVAAATVLLLALFVILTGSRSRDWASDTSVFLAAARVQPRAARPHFILAKLRAKEGRFEEALALLDKTLEVWPEYVMAWNEKGIIYGQRGDLAHAESMFRETVRLSPSYAAAHLNLGITFHRQHRIEEARRSLRKAVLWEPGLEKAWAELGHLDIETRRYDEAVHSYERAVELGRHDLIPRLREAERQSANAPNSSPN